MTRTGGAAFELSTLPFGQGPPNSNVVPELQGETQAEIHDRAAVTHRLGLRDLHQGRTRVADRKEQLRVLTQASSAIRPVGGPHLWEHLGPLMLAQEPGLSCDPPNRP